MPNPNFTDILTSTLANYVGSGKFQDNIFDPNVLFYWLNQKGAKTYLDGGERIVEPLLYAKNSTAKSFDGYDTIDTTPQDGLTAAEFNWKMEAVSITISVKEQLQNKGAEKMIDLLKTKTTQAEMSVRDIMNSQAFADGTGNGNKDLLGLGAIIAAAGTLGGIDRAANAWWNAQVDAVVENITTLAKLTTMYNNCSRGNDHPELIITTQDLYEWYESKLQPNMRFSDNKLGDGGFQNLKFKGATISYDADTTAGDMLFLNSKYLKMRVHRDADFKTTDFKQPTNQLAFVAQIYWMGNLTVNNCRMLGKLSGKTGA